MLDVIEEVVIGSIPALNSATWLDQEDFREEEEVDDLEDECKK